MRLSLRFVIPLLLALGLLGWALVPLVDRMIVGWFVRDLDMRATLVANTSRERVHDLVQAHDRRRLLQYFSRLTEDERVFAVAFCPADGSARVATATMPDGIDCAALDRPGPAHTRLLPHSGGILLAA